MMALTAAQRKAERIASLQEQEAAASAFGADQFTGNQVAKLKPEQYPTKTITDRYGSKVQVYTSGPLAGRDKITGDFVIEQAAQVYQPFVTGTPTSTPTVTATPTTTEDLLARQEAARIAEAGRRDRQSAYDILYNEFNKYGLSSLVEDIKYLIQSNVSPSQFSLELQNTKAYQDRFAANKDRISKGLKALSPAEYVGLEDQYQNIMRNYGLPDSYYAKDTTGKQAGFEKFLAGDVSPVELEDRIATAQNRVLKSNPEVLQSLKSFYPDITNADVLAYTLDPKNALENIKRKVTAAEIGGAATQAGLGTGMARAEELAAAGISKAQAQQGFQSVAAVAPRGTQLAEIYGQQPYGQIQAEQEVFGLAGSTEARRQREKLVGLEQAAFGGRAGAAQGALGRERAGNL
jgi:hypothetical protein